MYRFFDRRVVTVIRLFTPHRPLPSLKEENAKLIERDPPPPASYPSSPATPPLAPLPIRPPAYHTHPHRLNADR